VATFQKGQVKKGGRKKGVQNKFTVGLKQAILQAAEDVGQDGKGQDGLLGYLRRQAVENPPAYMVLLGKVLPSTLTADPDSEGPLVVEIVKFRYSEDDPRVVNDPSYPRLPGPTDNK
jgi:hypothetical protein